MGLLSISFDTAPVVSLPMNEAIGTVLVGSVNGTMTSGATVGPGLMGKGVFLSSKSSKVDFGFHPSACFYDPDICIQGVTFGMWIKLPQGAQSGLLLNTGGVYDERKGNLLLPLTINESIV